MNHGLNLGGIEAIQSMEGTKKGAMGLMRSSGTVKDVHHAVEREMKMKVSFKVIGERHGDMWIDGVQLGMKEILIYLIEHFGSEENARATGCEIAIMVDGSKLDNYCIHVTCGFKMTDNDPRDTLEVDEKDPLERGKFMLQTFQLYKNAFPITSIIAKDNKSTYNKFLHHIFEVVQEFSDVGVPELRCKPFRVSEPQYMNISQLCMNAKQIPYFCHLFQKHSDNIGRPNQMPCGKCAQICGKGFCYHYTLMDSNVIRKLLAKKETIDKTDEGQRLTFVCEQVYGGDWDAYYAACDLQSVLGLMLA
jgi:hypothetical protein